VSVVPEKREIQKIHKAARARAKNKKKDCSVAEGVFIILCFGYFLLVLFVTKN